MSNEVNFDYLDFIQKKEQETDKAGVPSNEKTRLENELYELFRHER